MKLTKSILLRTSALAGMCLLLSVIAVQAGNLSVNTCEDSGFGSLRQAIVDANASGVPTTISIDLSTIDPCYHSGENTFTINLQSSLPDLPLLPLIIDNSMPHFVLVTGNDTFRIFNLLDGSDITMNNLSIKRGNSNNDGGAVFMGADSSLTLNGMNVASNNAVGNGGAIFMSAGAILGIHKSTLSYNLASAGGAIYMGFGTTLNLDSSTLFQNVAQSGDGGAIRNGSLTGTINAINVTLDENIAGINGGAIYNAGTLTMTNSTVTFNRGIFGGGIYNNLNADLTNNLIALNTTWSLNPADGFDLCSADSGFIPFTGKTESISRPDGVNLCGGGFGLPAQFTGDFNLIGTIDGSYGVSSGNNRFGNQFAPIDPVIDALNNYGGPTPTRRLLAGSPAIDKGNSSVMLLDQRGRPRPFDDPLIANDAGNGADMGAYEFELGPSAAEVSISGRIVTMADSSERGIAGATISLTANDGNIQTARTNAFGYFQFSEVLAGESYIVQIQHKQYQFNAETLTVLDEIADLTYLAIPAPTQLGRNSQRR